MGRAESGRPKRGFDPLGLVTTLVGRATIIAPGGVTSKTTGTFTVAPGESGSTSAKRPDKRADGEERDADQPMRGVVRRRNGRRLPSQAKGANRFKDGRDDRGGEPEMAHEETRTIEIRAAEGGADARLFVAELACAYLAFGLREG